MNAIELFHKDGKPTGIYYCEKCRIIHRTKAEAEACCTPNLCSCGKVAKMYYTKCQECQDKAFNEGQAEHERRLFEKAKKIPMAEYKGPAVYLDGTGNNGFTEEIGELIAEIVEDGATLPEYVWACESVPMFNIDADDVLERCLEGIDNDMDYCIKDMEGVDAFRLAVDQFNEANKQHQLWEIDHRTAVIITNPNFTEQ